LSPKILAHTGLCPESIKSESEYSFYEIDESDAE
jgi:hypothetical protein